MVALDWRKAKLLVTNGARPEWLKKLPGVVSFVLLVAIAYGLASLTWLLVPGDATPRYVATSVSNNVVKSSPAARSDSIADIASWHLFGEVREEAVVLAPKQEIVPETKLRLELKGIWASSDPKMARAIISEPPRNENTYAIGSALPGGATLLEIHDDHIVLSRGGNKEKLLLPRESMQTADDAANASGRGLPSRSSRSDSFNANNPVVSRPVENFSANNSTTNGAGSFSRLAEVKQALNTNPQSLLGLASVVPEMKDGQITGYKLNSMQNEQLMRRFGLRRGDVITSVNGINLDGSTNLLGLLNELKSADQVRVEYSRRGRPRSVVLNMND